MRTAVIRCSSGRVDWPGGTAETGGVGNGITSIMSSPGTAITRSRPLKTITEILAHSRSCNRFIPVAMPHAAKPSMNTDMIRPAYRVNAGVEAVAGITAKAKIISAPESSVSPEPMKIVTAAIVTFAGRLIVFLWPHLRRVLLLFAKYIPRSATSGGCVRWHSAGLVGVSLQQCENHYAGDGDVQPDGKSVARDALVLREAAAEREEKSDEDQRQRHDGENNVAGEG